MRKQNKIVSLVLVLALLLGMLVIVPGAEDASSSSTGTSESFTPTATWTTASNANEALAAGSLFNSAGLSNWNESSVSAQLVTTAGGDKYVTLVAKADKTTANHFLNVGMSSKPVLDFTNSVYVIEMDLASESGMIAGFTINPIIGFSGSSSGTRLDPNPNDTLANHDVLSDGNWHHYAMVGSLATNELKIYIDGELVQTKTAYNATNKTTQDAADSATAYYFDSVRVNVGSGAAMTEGTSLSIDNLSLKVGTDATYGTEPAVEKLPAIAKVNGVEYGNVNAVTDELNGILPATVDILRQFAGTVTVNCDATVDTHGCSCSIVAGADVSTETNGTVTTYDAEFKSSVTESDASSASTTTIKDATSLAGVSSYGGSSNYTDETVKPYLVTDVVTGNKYVDIRPGSAFTTGTTHNHFNWYSANTVYEAGAYVIVEFDTYTESEVMTDLYVNLTSRNTNVVPAANATSGSQQLAGSNLAGAQMHIKNWGLSTGEWAHVTMIGSVNDNVLYVYVNGVKVADVAKGLFNGYTDDAATVLANYEPYFQGIRVQTYTRTNLTAEQNFAIDNVKYTLNTTDSWIASNLGAASLEGWSGNSYVLPEIPLLATVDGEPYYSPAELSAALVGNTAKKAELYRDYFGTVTVNCDATVETNGFTAPAAGTVNDENVSVTNDGTVYTYDAPYAPSSNDTVVTNNTDIVNAITGNAADNLFASIQNNVQSTHGMKTELVQNIVDGGNYLRVTKDGTENNAYLEVQSITFITPNENTQYYVLDMDFAILDPSVSVGFSPVPRKVEGTTYTGMWESGTPTLSAILTGYSAGEMQHVTSVVNLDTNTQYIFVNGTLVRTVTGNGFTSATNYTNSWEAGLTVKFDGFRIGSNLGGKESTSDAYPNAGYVIDNVNLRYLEETSEGYAADSLTSAIENSKLSAWSAAITEIETKTAPVATVDGEYVYSATALNAALNGTRKKTVELVNDISETVTVNCSATVETNGLAVTLAAGADIESSSTDGTVYTYVAKWKSSVTEETTSYGSFIIDDSVNGNLFAPKLDQSAVTLVNNSNGQMVMYKVTDVNTGNTYLKLQPTADGTMLTNVYLSTEIISASTSTSDACVLKDGEGYYVYDLDIATDGNIIETMNLEPVARNQASEKSTFPFPSAIVLNGYEFSDGEWMHMTVVGDMAANVQYVFVNGALIGTAGQANKEAGTYEYLNVKGFRMNLPVGVSISKDQTILMDNISARVYKTADAADGLADAITAGSLADWAYNVDKDNGKLPSIATVNGVEYTSVDALTAALSDGKNLTVSLDRAVAGTVYASTTATITTNGLANFIEAANGYSIEDNGDGTYTVKLETRMGSITVTINGINAITADVLHGTDIAEYLRLNNAYVFDIIAADNGQVYTGAEWEAAPAGVVDGDEVLSVTATAATGDIVVRDASGASITGDFETLLNTNGVNYTIVMNADHEMSKQLTLQGTKTVYMAGHAITFAAANAGSHAFQIDGANHAITFIGGSIVDDVRSSTQAIFYAGYDFASEIKCVNANIYAVGNIGNQRGGTFTFEDCSINLLECQSSFGFSVAEYYNAGYTYLKCTLNLINSDIQYVHFTEGRTQAFITLKDYTEWGGKTDTAEQAAIAKGYDKVVHEINVSGCNVRISFGAALVQNTNALAQINIDNSRLNLKQLYHSNSTYPQNINVGDNVVSAIPLTGVSFGEGVVQVNSGNPTAPYLYANEYATVIWEDGASEKWADGTYPVSTDTTYVIEKVEAGKTYTFAKGQPSISMKANLTLDANLKLNVYLATDAGITAVNIAGVEYSVEGATVVKIDGADYYQFAYEIAPYYAAADLTIAVSLGGATYAKSISLVEYVGLAIQADASSTNLMKAVVEYVAAASAHVGAYLENYEAANNYADADAVELPTEGVNTMTNVSAYVSGASLDLTYAPKWAFKVVDGADISELVITVDGEEVEYTVSSGYVYVELPAYDMLKTVTVKVGGAEGQCDFAAYYLAMSALNAGLTDPSTTNWRAGANIDGAEAYHAMRLLNAFYKYASYAAAYKA